MQAIKRATSLCNSFFVAKQVARFCCPFSKFSKFRDKIKLINSKFELTDHEIIARNLGKINFHSV